MAIVIAIPGPNGTGAAADVSALNPEKTFVVGGTLAPNEALVVEGTADPAAAQGWNGLAVFTSTDPAVSTVVVPAAVNWVRARRATLQAPPTTLASVDQASFTPTLTVDASIGATQVFQALTVPAGNGSGASLNVGAQGTTLQLTLGGGPMGAQEQLLLEGSQDNAAWDSLLAANSTYPGRLLLTDVRVTFVRVTRRSVGAQVVTAFLGTSTGGAGGGAGSETLHQAYNAGAGVADQTMTVTNAKGPVVVDAGLTATTLPRNAAFQAIGPIPAAGPNPGLAALFTSATGGNGNVQVDDAAIVNRLRSDNVGSLEIQTRLGDTLGVRTGVAADGAGGTLRELQQPGGDWQRGGVHASAQDVTAPVTGLDADAAGNAAAGLQVPLATNAVNGFPFVPSMPGPPSGAPAAAFGGAGPKMAAMTWDSTNKRAYWRDQLSAAWKTPIWNFNGAGGPSVGYAPVLLATTRANLATFPTLGSLAAGGYQNGAQAWVADIGGGFGAAYVLMPNIAAADGFLRVATSDDATRQWVADNGYTLPVRFYSPKIDFTALSAGNVLIPAFTQAGWLFQPLTGNRTVITDFAGTYTVNGAGRAGNNAARNNFMTVGTAVPTVVGGGFNTAASEGTPFTVTSNLTFGGVTVMTDLTNPVLIDVTTACVGVGLTLKGKFIANGYLIAATTAA